MSKNDETIVKLKEEIAKKKEALGTAKRFVPGTNCSLELDNVRYNLHTTPKGTLTFLLVKLTSLIYAADQLSINQDAVKVCGFTLQDWATDIKAKLEVIAFADKFAELKGLESRLDKLMSEDKRTELELQEILKQIGE